MMPLTNHTSGEFINGANHTSGEFINGTNHTSGEFISGTNHASGEFISGVSQTNHTIINHSSQEFISGGSETSSRKGNPCKTGENKCSKNAHCVYTLGSYQCYCNTGFHGDGFNCSEGFGKPMMPLTNHTSGEFINGANHTSGEFINGTNHTSGEFISGMSQTSSKIGNPCKTGENKCSKNAHCVYTLGSYQCYCNPGFNGDGFKCSKVSDEQMMSETSHSSEEFFSGVYKAIGAGQEIHTSEHVNFDA